jgi:putative heme-binding domain-containing protein
MTPTPEADQAAGAAAVAEDLLASHLADDLAVDGDDYSHEPITPVGRPFVQRWQVSDFERLAEQLGASPRDVARGKLIFVAECLHCHKVKGVGGGLGPDLTAIGKTMTPEQIVRETLEPSAEIREEYRQVQIELDDGRILSGLPIRENDGQLWIVEDLLRSRQPILIPKDRIEDQRFSGVSAMPSGSLDTYTKMEALDLFEFLVSCR